jgi:methylamine dehydrogenase heavy chain
MLRSPLAAALALLLAGLASAASVEPERGSVATLPSPPGRHWLWVDTVGLGVDSRVYLVDADDGRVLGMVSTGYFADPLSFAPDGRSLYCVETFFSRYTRGERSDLVTVYDAASLAPVQEVPLPPKRAVSFPMLNKSALSDDGRFLLVYNYTPAQSVSVVDLAAGSFAGEIETPGCALVFPSGSRHFRMLCGDGALLTVVLDESGHALRKQRSQPFFEPHADPVTEKAVRVGDEWLFVSADGFVHAVSTGAEEPAFAPRWSLLSDEERAASWRIGGAQHLAVHRASGRLYSAMHQGEPQSYKQPGVEIWVYELATRRRVQRIEAVDRVQALEVSQDAQPLLYASFMGAPQVQVYDAVSGAHLRTLRDLLLAPSLLRAVPAPAGAARP